MFAEIEIQKKAHNDSELKFVKARNQRDILGIILSVIIIISVGLLILKFRNAIKKFLPFL